MMADPIMMQDGHDSEARPQEQDTVVVARLLHRADFVAASRGKRRDTAAFGLQARLRAPDENGSAPRFGLTITKKTAKRAVERNRIRRRLREALRLGAALPAQTDHDYVLVGRQPALTMPFSDLRAAVASTIKSIGRHDGRQRERTPRKKVSSGRATQDAP